MKWFLIFCCLFSSLSAGEYWGYQLTLDCKACEADIDDARVLADFVSELVAEIDMKAYGEPILAYFAEHDPEAAGYSLMQLIETSSITGHFVSKNRDAYLDIFSCKPFDPEKAIEFVRKKLQPEGVKATFARRQA